MASQYRVSERPVVWLYYLDNFRSYLTALVIYHHTSIAYGGEGGWLYHSPYHTRLSSPTFMVFTAFNQTYFMGSFFLLSGYFSAFAANRSERKKFLTVKVRRLGIPTLIYTFIAGPMQIATLRILAEKRELTWSIVTEYWKGIRGIRGPVWYCSLLLIFDAIFALLQPRAFRAMGRRSAKDQNQYSRRKKSLDNLKYNQILVLACVLATAVTSFFIRLLYPIGRTFTPLNLLPGYLPHYIAAYTAGISIASHESTVIFTRNTKLMLLSISITTTFIGLLLPRIDLAEVRGGLNVPAALYALWNECTGAFMFALPVIL